MKESFTFLSLLTCLCFLPSAHAEVLKDARGSMEITVPKGWDYAQNVLGMPHLWVSPLENERRNTMGLTFTGLKGANWTAETMAKEQGNYQTGRVAWAKKTNATIKQFLRPYVGKTVDQKLIHGVGYVFEKNGTLETEGSYFILCPSSLNHLKVLAMGDEAKMNAIISPVLKSLKCL